MRKILGKNKHFKSNRQIAEEVFNTYNVGAWGNMLDSAQIYRKLLTHKHLTKKESIYTAYSIKQLKDKIAEQKRLISIYDPNSPENLLFDRYMESLDDESKQYFIYDDPAKKGFRVEDDIIYYNSKPLRFNGKPKELLYVFLTKSDGSRILTKKDIAVKLQWREELVPKNIDHLKNKLKYIYGSRESIQTIKKDPITYKLYLPDEL